jgi:hypothetical protein
VQIQVAKTTGHLGEVLMTRLMGNRQMTLRKTRIARVRRMMTMMRNSATSKSRGRPLQS